MPEIKVIRGYKHYCYYWNDGNINWSNNPFTWNEVCLSRTVFQGYKSDDYDPWAKSYDKLKEEDKKKFITLINKCQGTKYKVTKEVKDVKISSKHIQLTVEAVLKPQIKIIL
jgi:hypothetical protein